MTKDYTHTEMIDGHPRTWNKMFRNRPAECDSELLSDSPPEIQEKVMTWIKENIYPRKTPLPVPTSYGLKHYLQDEMDIYLTNNAFKDAMLQCGFELVDWEELNWVYRISKKSPAFTKNRR